MDPKSQDTDTNQPMKAESLQEFGGSAASLEETSAASVVPSATLSKRSDHSTDHHKHAKFFRIFLICSLIGLFALTAGGIFWLSKFRRTNPPQSSSVNDKYEITTLSVDQLGTAAQSQTTGNPSQVAINGNMQVGGTLTLIPSERPSNAAPGQQYIDKRDNKLYVFNGSAWLAQLSVADLTALNAKITNLDVDTAKINNLITGNQPAGNATLQGNIFNGPSQLVQLTSGGLLPALNGSQLSQLNASSINSGSLADAHLSTNVAMRNQSQTFSGQNLFQNSADSTSSFVIQNSIGTSNLFVADTTNTRIGIGVANPNYTLDVSGDVNLATGGSLRFGGTPICTNLGCMAAGGSGSYIQNDTNLQASANFNIQSASDITPTTQVRARALQTANLSEWQDAAGLAVTSISPSGAVAAASFTGVGSGLTNLNAANISSGVLNDARLSPNVALLDATQVFTGTSNTFNGIIYSNAVTPTSAMTIGSTDQSLTLQGNGSTLVKAVSGTGLNTNTTTVGFAAAYTNNRNINYVFRRNVASGTYDVCTTSGNCMGGGASGGANAALSNLSSVAINTSLLPGVAGAVSLGSNALPFGEISFAGTASTPASQNFTLTGNPTGQRVITIPDATGTICLTIGNCMGGGAGGGANAALSNLSSVAINTSLLPGVTNSIDLGSNSYNYKDLWLGGVIQGGAATAWIANSGGNTTSINFAAPSGNNVITVPAANGTMAVSASGNIALSGAGNISFTGTLPVGSGGTGSNTLLQNGVLYGNGSGAIGATTAGTTGQCLIGQTGAAPVFSSCASAGSGVTLQAAYDNGNSIATTDARNLTVTLADTTTDANFLVNIASGSSGKFAIQNGGTDMLKVDISGGVLASTDVTINKKSNTAAGSFTQYQATTSTGYPNIITGTYTGDGNTTKTVTLPVGWGEPKFVMIMPHDNVSFPVNNSTQGAYRTYDMPANYAKAFGSGGSILDTGFINSMGSDSFVVTYKFDSGLGRNIGGNLAGRNYSFIAIRTDNNTNSDDYFAYGNYTGNAADNRTICINGGTPGSGCTNGSYSWAPDYVMVTEHDLSGNGSEPVFRSSEMTGDSSLKTAMSVSGFLPNNIQSLGSGKFEVGTSEDINENSQQFYWFAFRNLPGFIKTGGPYLGTGTPQNITGVGFKPEWVFTKSAERSDANNAQGAVKLTPMGTNAISTYGGYASNIISSFDNDGFTLGNSSYANNNNFNYYYAAMKSYTSTSTVNGYSAGAVYNGKFYTATKRPVTSEIYRYDGGTNYTRVSSSTAGKITGTEASPVVSSVPTMKVFDNKLFIGTDSGAGGNAGAIYYCSNGSGNCNANTDWTQVNTTAGTLDGSTTNIDGIKSMSVIGGVLYVGTYESNGAEIYRYNGGTGAAVFTKVSDTTAGKMVTGDTANIDAVNLVNYRGMLVAGTETGAGTAGVYYLTGDSSWSLVNPTRGSFASTTNIDDVSALAVYNGSLVFGTGDGTANMAEIYRYNAPQGGATSGSNLFSKISDSTAGRIDSTGSARVDSIGAMTVYNGTLLAASNNASADGNATIYKFDGVSSWSKLGSQAEGTLGGTSGVDGVLFMTQYNDTLFSGSAKSSAGYIYTTNENTSMSNALKFVGSSDGSFNNIGSIAFMSGDQSDGGFNNQGQFLLSHTLTTAAGAYDIAEDYQTSDDELVAGDVAAIDPGSSTGFVRRADLARGDGLRLLGVVSTKPAFRLSQTAKSDAAAGSRAVPVALAGRVPVKIDPDSDSIEPGDYLTASSKPGLAVKTNRNGSVIGKSLASWKKGGDSKTVEIFVSNTFLLPNGEPIETGLREQIETGLRKVSLLDAFFATGEEGLQLLKNTTFIGNVFFKKDALFGGRVAYTDTDMAGHAVVKTGVKQVKIKFDKPYDQPPIVSVSPQEFVVYKVKDRDKDGFTIELENSATTDVNFDWLAVQLRDAKTTQSEPPPPN